MLAVQRLVAQRGKPPTLLAAVGGAVTDLRNLFIAYRTLPLYHFSAELQGRFFESVCNNWYKSAAASG
jgi:hypothetical protein